MKMTSKMNKNEKVKRRATLKTSKMNKKTKKKNNCTK